jgi:hypothetical protein
MKSNYAIGVMPEFHQPSVPIPSVHLPIPDTDTRTQVQMGLTMQHQAHAMQRYLQGFLGGMQ